VQAADAFSRALVSEPDNEELKEWLKKSQDAAERCAVEGKSYRVGPKVGPT
jgi:hypothetical protein